MEIKESDRIVLRLNKEDGRFSREDIVLSLLTLSCHHNLFHPPVLVQQPRELLYPLVLPR